MTTKIMLVEDDTNLGDIYKARLEAEGFQIISANDGEAALALAVKEHPDLIISDVMMPKISGFDMLDILRGTDGIKDTKVIMMTALGQAEDRARAEKLGADRYLVKSQVTLEDVIRTVHEVLEDQGTPPAAVAQATEPVAPAPEPTAPVAAPADIAQPPIQSVPVAVASPDQSTPNLSAPQPVNGSISAPEPQAAPTTQNPIAPAPVEPAIVQSPTPASTPAAPATHMPAATADNAAGGGQPNASGQTVADEKESVLSQIEDFVDRQENGEAQAAVDASARPPALSPEPPQNSVPAETTGSAAEPITDQTEESGPNSPTIANRKIIQPISSKQKSNLADLLIKERGESQPNSLQPASKPSITNTAGSIDGILAPGTNGPPHAAGTVIQPSAPTSGQDPSSIAI